MIEVQHKANGTKISRVLNQFLNRFGVVDRINRFYVIGMHSYLFLYLKVWNELLVL